MIFIEYEPLASKTWFLIGGPARWYCRPTNPEEFQQAVDFAHKKNLATFVLGAGANLLINDTGFNGLVIHPESTPIKTVFENDTELHIQASAGTHIDQLISYCLDNNALGLEEFSGIPGTVGGSVYINIHYFEFLLSSFLVTAHVIHIPTNTIHKVDTAWFNFGYNQSRLQTEPYYLLDATFKVTKTVSLQAAYARGRSDEMKRYRTHRYPSARTCGSFFRNFSKDEVAYELSGKQLPYVAYYLDQIGVKGQASCGDAWVSHQHANMLVNKGSATACDIITLARNLQEKVFDRFGIIPQSECQFIGFNNYPLHTSTTLLHKPHATPSITKTCT